MTAQPSFSFFKDTWVSSDLSSITKKVLSNKELWGKDLSEIDGIAKAVEKHLVAINAEGRN